MTSYPTPQHPPQQSYPPGAYQPPPSNGLGIAGFVVSLSGLLLCGGFLCPIGLLLSLIGLRKEPRGFAIAGSIIGLLGSLIAVLIALAIAGVINAGGSMFNFFSNHWQTQMTMSDAQWEIDSHYDNNNNTLPDSATGNGIIASFGYTDEWGTLLEYRPDANSPTDYQIASAGPDMQFGTSDDLVNYHTAGFSFGGSATATPGSPFDDTGPGQAQIDYAFDLAAKQINTASKPGMPAPDAATGNELIRGMRDAWNTEIRYEPNTGAWYRLLSAGPDRQWHTDDDIALGFMAQPASNE